VLQGEEDVLALSGKVGIGVSEGVQVGASSKGLPGLSVGPLAGVMDEGQGHVEGSLKVPEVAQESRDVLTAVFIPGVKPHQRIEDQKPRPEVGDGGAEAFLVSVGVEAYRRFDDDRDVEVVERKPSVAAEGFEAAADLGATILGQVDESPAGGLNRETVEGGSAGGDADGEVESKMALHRLGRAADHAHSFPSPEALDEPPLLGAFSLEIPGEDGGEDLRFSGSHGQRTFRAATT
jgi:hypothetical protein